MNVRRRRSNRGLIGAGLLLALVIVLGPWGVGKILRAVGDHHHQPAGRKLP